MLIALFLRLVGWLVVSRALAIDWLRVMQSLREMRVTALCSAALLAMARYAIYACFDWFSRIYTKQVPKLRQFEIAWVSYAFNLNLGSLVGSVGFRYRLYARSGVEPRNIARIVATSTGDADPAAALMLGTSTIGARGRRPDEPILHHTGHADRGRRHRRDRLVSPARRRRCRDRAAAGRGAGAGGRVRSAAA
ncbi:MAG: hypothetical protein QM661_11040, partial [Solimonas sp.]